MCVRVDRVVGRRGKQIAVVAIAIGCVAMSLPAHAFDSHRSRAAAGAIRRGAAGNGSRATSREQSNESPTLYNVDPLNYNERWTSMFGSEFPITKRVSLFADYQYDQWAPHSSGRDISFRAWENYRVTFGCSVRY